MSLHMKTNNVQLPALRYLPRLPKHKDTPIGCISHKELHGPFTKNPRSMTEDLGATHARKPHATKYPDGITLGTPIT